jgi:hypothetical protein
MNKATASLIAALGALTLAAVAWFAGPLAPAPAQAGNTSATLSFDVRFSPFFLLDFRPDGVREITSFQDPNLDPSKGDQTIFRDELLRRGRVVGHESGACVATDDPSAAGVLPISCQMTVELPQGQITAQGAASNDPAKHLAITGGTGRYTGAAGELVLTEFGNDTGSLVVHLAQRTS